MPEVVPHLKNVVGTGKARQYRASPTRLDFGPGGQPAKISLSNGSDVTGTCLGCRNAPCMTLSVSDTELPEPLSSFPGDPAKDVCPTSALFWNNDENNVTVDQATCIGCGLCIVRCPYGAISLDAAGKAVVETSDPDSVTTTRLTGSDLSAHPKLQRVGRIGPPNSPALRYMPSSLAGLNDLESTKFVRNLLIACGVKCRTRRKGDTNIRMDGVIGLADGRLGVLEIELGNAMLESPRALLEDVAVLHGRSGIAVNNIDPVSVVLSLPNNRSEYFRVIEDIEMVLGIRCRTVTIGALLAILWQFQTLGGLPAELFATFTTDTNLFPAMKKLISDAIPAEQPYPGAYWPTK